MGTAAAKFLIAVPLLAQILAAFPVKVLSIDNGRVRFLLPLHFVEMLAVTDQEELAGMEVGQWYGAAVEAGKVGTTEKNYLVVQLPKGRARLRLLEVVIKE